MQKIWDDEAWEDLSGFWSRRIDEKNRLVYRIQNGILEISQCRTHYKK